MPKRKSNSQRAQAEPVVRIIRPDDLGFGRLFNQLSDAVVVTDAETGMIVLWNIGAEALYGYSAQEAIGMALEDLMPEHERRPYRKAVEAFLSTGRASLLGARTPTRVPGLTKDGREVMIELTLSRIDDADLAGTFVVAVMRDVTEHNRLEAENRQNEVLLRENAGLLSAIIENTSDAVYVKDLTGRYMLINEAGAQALGMRVSAIIGRTDEEVAGAAAAAVFRSNDTQAAEKRRAITCEEQFDLPDGRTETFLTSKHPLIDASGQVTGIVGISHNITERKRDEERLKCRASQQLAVAQLGQRALSGLELPALFDEATRVVTTVLMADFVEVLELLPGGSALRLMAGTGWDDGQIGRTTVPTGLASQAGYTLRSREPVVVADLATETRFRGSALLTEHHVVSGVSVVIGGREVPFGVLGAHCLKPTRFNPDDVNFMQGVANVLALAIARKEAEQALRASETRWKALVNHAPEVIAEIDREFRLRFVNRAPLGTQPDDLIGHSIFEYIPPEEHDRLRALYTGVFADGQPARFEMRGPDREGQPTWYQSSVGARVVDGVVDSAVVISHDITEYKRALEALRTSEQQLAKAQAIAHLGNWEWDAAANRVAMSEELYRMAGIVPTPDANTFEDRLATLHPEDAPATRAAFQVSATTGVPLNIDYRVLQPDGTLRFVHARAEAERDAEGRVIRLVGTAQDITELKLAAEELERRTAELDRARELDHLKNLFVNSVSHELRTPLTSIVGYAEFLEDEIGGPISQEQREFVEEILKGGRRLERLVDDLLDFARIDAGTFKLRLEPVDLAEKAREIVASLQPQAIAAQLTLEVEVPETPLVAVMDPQRIGQVLTNLLMNAIKFTPEGGDIRLTVSKADGRLRCEVTDTGPGISPEDQARLFQRFSQLENSRRKGGAGLGLSISKALVEAHSGRIGVRSDVDRGATFWFTLPLRGPAAERG